MGRALTVEEGKGRTDDGLIQEAILGLEPLIMTLENGTADYGRDGLGSAGKSSDW